LKENDLKITVAIKDPAMIPRKTNEPNSPSFSLLIFNSSLISLEAAGIAPWSKF